MACASMLDVTLSTAPCTVCDTIAEDIMAKRVYVRVANVNSRGSEHGIAAGRQKTKYKSGSRERGKTRWHVLLSSLKNV